MDIKTVSAALEAANIDIDQLNLSATSTGGVYVDFKPMFRKGKKTDDLALIRMVGRVADALEEANLAFVFRSQSRNVENEGGRQVTTWRPWAHFFVNDEERATAGVEREQVNELKAEVSELKGLLAQLLKAQTAQAAPEPAKQAWKSGGKKMNDDGDVPF
jgi:hypothetical protein